MNGLGSLANGGVGVLRKHAPVVSGDAEHNPMDRLLCYYPAVHMGVFKGVREALASVECVGEQADRCIDAALTADERCVCLPGDSGLWLVLVGPDGDAQLYLGLLQLAIPAGCAMALQSHRRACAISEAQEVIDDLHGDGTLSTTGLVVEFVCECAPVQ